MVATRVNATRTARLKRYEIRVRSREWSGVLNALARSSADALIGVLDHFGPSAHISVRSA